MNIPEHPLVSVIIPTYNRSEFVCEAIESVLQQTYPYWELIIVDDGSTDNTNEILKRYSRIKYIKQNHSGVSAARNRGISSSSGDYVAFLDSDDYWKKDKLEKQMLFFVSNTDIKICQTDEIWIRNGKWANPGKRHMKNSGWIFEPSLSLCLITPSSVAIHRDVFEQIGLFDDTLPACEDYDLWLRLTIRYPVHSINEKLIVKRGGHADQLSKTWGLDRFRIKALEKLLKQEELKKEQREKVILVMIKKIKIYSSGCLKRGRIEEYNRYQTKLATYTHYEQEKQRLIRGQESGTRC